jgi:hypothetical protein
MYSTERPKTLIYYHYVIYGQGEMVFFITGSLKNRNRHGYMIHKFSERSSW